MSNLIEGKRWSGFDWADQQKQIMMIGAGGIGSWTCLSLSRIMHEIVIIGLIYHITINDNYLMNNST